jgi:hypothetical protein
MIVSRRSSIGRGDLVRAGEWFPFIGPFQVPSTERRLSPTRFRTFRRALAVRGIAPVAALEVMEPSFNLAVGSLALGSIFGVPKSPVKSKVAAFAAGVPLALFGIFLAYQTTTLRFTFDDANFSLVKADLTSTGENVVVGGHFFFAHAPALSCISEHSNASAREASDVLGSLQTPKTPGQNSWAYSSFVNYDFFPSESFPILVMISPTTWPPEASSLFIFVSSTDNERYFAGPPTATGHGWPRQL